MLKTTMTIVWIVHKDLLTEFRARQVWPATAMLGAVAIFVFCAQIGQSDSDLRMLSAVIWLTAYLIGMLAIHRTIGAEYEESCWTALRLYRMPPECIFAAKLIVNFVMLSALHGVLLVLGGHFADASLLREPLSVAAIVLLGNLGFAAVGTSLSSILSCWQRGAVTLAFLTIPLCAPVILAASEATWLATTNRPALDWWRWAGLLVAFDVAFIAAGALLFETLIED